MENQISISELFNLPAISEGIKSVNLGKSAREENLIESANSYKLREFIVKNLGPFDSESQTMGQYILAFTGLSMQTGLVPGLYLQNPAEYHAGLNLQLQSLKDLGLDEESDDFEAGGLTWAAVHGFAKFELEFEMNATSANTAVNDKILELDESLKQNKPNNATQK